MGIEAVHDVGTGVGKPWSTASRTPTVAKWKLPLLVLGGLTGGVMFLALGPIPGVDTAENAQKILVTVLSILSGFLLATTTLLGDPSALLAGSWRVASAERSYNRKVLDRLTALFFAYVLTILAAYVGTLLDGYLPDHASRWVAHVVLSLGVTVLVWSLGLPVVVRARQLRRLDTEVDKRAKDTGFKPLPMSGDDGG